MALFGPCVVCVFGVPEDPEYRCVHTFHRANYGYYGYYKQFVCSSCMEHVESSWGSEASSPWWSTEDEMADDGEAESDGADSDESYSMEFQ